ncbi:MAG: alcohol dehydrogenase catalytic domain-containing protein [Proteobacteria bacterium]|nr:alcohol dehydrogenase catalytic domain-containing protein [Pseudomonadota bacterium]
MKAFQLVRPGAMGELRSVAQPAPGQGEVLIKVGGAGLCHSDLHFMHGDFAHVPYLNDNVPFTLGHEPAGWVEAVGAGVHGFERGQPVIVYPIFGCGHCAACHAGLDHRCQVHAASGPALGLGVNGALAEYMLVKSARQLLPLGDLDPRQAAPLTDAALTPYHAIRRNLQRLRPGATVVVIGVGGLGQMAVQLLSVLSPARIVAVDRSADKLAAARALGAAATVVADAEASRALRDATRGQRADLVIDLVGVDATLKLAASSVAAGGRIEVIGVAGGKLDWSFARLALEASIGSSYWGTPTELREIVALAQAGRIGTRVERFTLDDTARAYGLLEAGQIEGRAVVTPHG